MRRAKTLVVAAGLAWWINACGDDDEPGAAATRGGSGGGAAAGGSAGAAQTRGGANNAGAGAAAEGGSAGTDPGSAGAVASGGASVAGAGGSAGTSAGGEGGALTGAGGAQDSFTCDEPGDDPAGTPNPSCAPTVESNACQLCIEQDCCDAFKDCNAFEPYDVCGFGGPGTWPASGGEFACVMDCINDAYDPESGGLSLGLVESCLLVCATPACTFIGARTNSLTACLVASCEDVCFY